MNKRERNYHHSGNYHNTMRNLSNSELDAVKTICEKINQKTIINHSSFITSDEPHESSQNQSCLKQLFISMVLLTVGKYVET